MYLMTVTRNGVSAKELERALGLTYKTCWRMTKLIREQMGRGQHPGKLKGAVEMEETYYGKRDSQHTGRDPDKSVVFAMVQRLGNVVAFM
jgi:hypothetical protein